LTSADVFHHAPSAAGFAALGVERRGLESLFQRRSEPLGQAILRKGVIRGCEGLLRFPVGSIQEYSIVAIQILVVPPCGHGENRRLRPLTELVSRSSFVAGTPRHDRLVRNDHFREAVEAVVTATPSGVAVQLLPRLREARNSVEQHESCEQEFLQHGLLLVG